MSGKTYNLTGIILCSLILAATIIIILNFVDFKGNPFHNLIGNILGNIKLGNFDIPALLSKNWPTILGLGATTVPLVYTTVKSYMDKAAMKKQLEAAQELAVQKETLMQDNILSSKTAVASAQNASAKEIEGLKAKLAEYENDPALESLQKNFSSSQTTIESLNNQLKGVQDLHNQAINDFWKASNNSIWKDPMTQKEYQVLKVETVKVK
jgi:hypothetical protein